LTPRMARVERQPCARLVPSIRDLGRLLCTAAPDIRRLCQLGERPVAANQAREGHDQDLDLVGVGQYGAIPPILKPPLSGALSHCRRVGQNEEAG
jgi:hypothetical protein